MEFKNPIHPVLTILLLFVFLLGKGFGQDSPSFFGISAGVSFPVGDYSRNSLDVGCFTQTGYNVTAEGAWFIISDFGMGASVGVNLHPVDIEALEKEKIGQDKFLESLTIRSEPYTIMTIMGGPYFRQRLFTRFKLSGKINGGVVYGRTPYQLYKTRYFQTGPDYYEITSARDWNLGGQASLGLRYEISPCFALVAEGEFTYSQLDFTFNSALGQTVNHRVITILNTKLGLRVNL